ncbi:Abscisic acid G-protein coupled receptor-domain-containing protein [Protomyces lactucae-debilis]|uniref:Abscisic acid G-protein coupled receptor-domain-containing protein n=1 Tax=Protomyces lactucae-debilis TaxID=2754530 RepID=A0A1Y2FLI5_PROLT|nr:Abscisic acid G-protein coupled receptor-domain-containing protein [Protomyces lactucae-debilis]ORY84818.1 Abscisic acid G-protein coupled receptor-domain-containing protein [Protomyces lactucae-debilis]
MGLVCLALSLVSLKLRDQETKTLTKTHKHRRPDDSISSRQTCSLDGPHRTTEATLLMDYDKCFAIVYLIGLVASFTWLSYHYAIPHYLAAAQIGTLVQATCALTLGFSFLIFFLIWAEFGDWVPSIRALAWQSSIACLLALMVLILPLLMNYGFFSEGTGVSARYRYLCTLLALGAELYLFYRLGDFLPSQTISHSFLQACVIRVGILGILTMALLSGFGAVSAIEQAVLPRRAVTETEVARLQEAVHMAEDQLEMKVRALEKQEAREAEAQHRGFVARWMGAISRNSEVEEMRLGVLGMQELLASLQADAATGQATLDDQQAAKTWRGKLFKVLDVLFSLYCVYRIAFTLYNLTPWKGQALDPVSRVLGLLATHYDEDIDRVTLTRQIGFLLSGVVIAGSLRACLISLARLSKVLPHVINQRSMALGFANILGSYNIATAIMLCRSVPSDYGKTILGNLGAALDQSQFEVIFDRCFILGTFGTTVILVLQRKMGGVSGDLEAGVEKRL